MFLFGGRGENGKNLNDTWIFDFEKNYWTLVMNNESRNLPLPSPRFFSSCNVVSKNFDDDDGESENIFLFGGTNGVENFGDLWVFRFFIIFIYYYYYY
jgi:hypothetical protein